MADEEDGMTSVDLDEELDEEIEELYEEEDEDDEDGEYDDAGDTDGLLKNPSSGFVNENSIAEDPARINLHGIGRNAFDDHLPPPAMKKKKLRNYEKIVTHFKDRKHDVESCGSVYFKDWEFGNDEIHIREIIKKCENRKLKQERRRRR